MAEAALARPQPAIEVTEGREGQGQVAKPGRLLILDVEHLLAPPRGLILVVEAKRFFQVRASGREFGRQEQRATEQEMSHDERRLGLLPGRSLEAFLGEGAAFREVGARDLERADSGKHRKDLGRLAERVTELQRLSERLAA